VECMAFSSDGRVLGVSTADGLLTIYDWHTGRALNVLRCAAAKFPAGCVCRIYCKYPVRQSSHKKEEDIMLQTVSYLIREEQTMLISPDTIAACLHVPLAVAFRLFVLN